jgi:hypothetical protein
MSNPIPLRSDVVKPNTHRPFSSGYRLCDTLLVLMLVGGGLACLALRTALTRAQHGWALSAFVLMGVVGLLGLLRVRIAFAITSGCFVAIAFAKGLDLLVHNPFGFFVPIPLTSGFTRWMEISICLGISAWFWSRYDGGFRSK